MGAVAEPLAILAGGGKLPLEVARAALAAGRPVLVLGIRGEAGPEIAGFPHDWIGWGEIGRIEALIRAHGARDVVLVGGVSNRPDYRSIKLDLGAVRVLPQLIKAVASGDDNAMRLAARIVESRGFRIVGAHEVAHDLVAEAGVMTRLAPAGHAPGEIELAMNAARVIGRLDAGQAAIVVGERVVALEGVEGTDAMIARVGELRASGRLKWKGRAGVLAKCAKPQQDLRLDMPVIGAGTMRAVADVGLAGIAIEAGRVMFAEREATIALADREGLFLTAVRPPEGGAP